MTTSGTIEEMIKGCDPSILEVMKTRIEKGRSLKNVLVSSGTERPTLVSAGDKLDDISDKVKRKVIALIVAELIYQSLDEKKSQGKDNEDDE